MINFAFANADISLSVRFISPLPFVDSTDRMMIEMSCETHKCETHKSRQTEILSTGLDFGKAAGLGVVIT